MGSGFDWMGRSLAPEALLILALEIWDLVGLYTEEGHSVKNLSPSPSLSRVHTPFPRRWSGKHSSTMRIGGRGRAPARSTHSLSLQQSAHLSQLSQRGGRGRGAGEEEGALSLTALLEEDYVLSTLGDLFFQ